MNSCLRAVLLVLVVATVVGPLTEQCYAYFWQEGILSADYLGVKKGLSPRWRFNLEDDVSCGSGSGSDCSAFLSDLPEYDTAFFGDISFTNLEHTGTSGTAYEAEATQLQGGVLLSKERCRLGIGVHHDVVRGKGPTDGVDMDYTGLTLTPGIRLANSSRMTSSSYRASGAPRQKWRPKPNEMCFRASFL